MPYSVHQQPWPAYDASLVTEAMVEVVVQVNGKVRDRLMLAADASEADAVAAALAAPKVAESLAGAEPRKVIYVPGRLVNIVR
jgi:leucyl-tRNA synthetase